MSGEKYKPTETVYREGGVALLVLRRSEEEMPHLGTEKGERRLRAVCEKLWDETVAYAETVRFPLLREAYLADENPKKRFTARPHILCYSLSFREEERRVFLQAVCRVTWRGRELFREENTFALDRESGFFLLEKAARNASLKKENKLKRRKSKEK